MKALLLKETYPTTAETENPIWKSVLLSFLELRLRVGVFDGSFAALTAWLQTDFKRRSQSVYTITVTRLYDKVDD